MQKKDPVKKLSTADIYSRAKQVHRLRKIRKLFKRAKKASGGLIERSGYRGGGLAVRGFGRAMKKGGKV